MKFMANITKGQTNNLWVKVLVFTNKGLFKSQKGDTISRVSKL